MDTVLRDITRRLDALERNTPSVRLGVVTDDSPPTITLGGSDVEIANVATLVPLVVGDNVIAVTYGNGLLVLGAVAGDGAWTAYTPTVTGTSITLGSGGLIEGRYAKNGRTVHACGRFVLGSGGSLTGSTIAVSLPVAAASAMYQYGVAHATDASPATDLAGISVVAASSSALRLLLPDATGGANPIVDTTATHPWVWASGDSMDWQITYEAAS